MMQYRIITYGLTEEQNKIVKKNIPSWDYEVFDTDAVDEFGEVMRTDGGYVTPYTERIAERIHDALEMGIEHEG